MAAVHGCHPTGALRASKFAPGEFVEPTVRQTVHLISNQALSTTQTPLLIFFCGAIKRRAGDFTTERWPCVIFLSLYRDKNFPLLRKTFEHRSVANKLREFFHFF